MWRRRRKLLSEIVLDILSLSLGVERAFEANMGSSEHLDSAWRLCSQLDVYHSA